MVAETMPATSDAVPLLGTRSVVIINDYDGGDPFGYPKPRPEKNYHFKPFHSLSHILIETLIIIPILAPWTRIEAQTD